MGKGYRRRSFCSLLRSVLRGCVDQGGWRVELRHDAVDGIALHYCRSFTSASRQESAHFKNRNHGQQAQEQEHAARNMPMVPMKVMQSQRVG